jgi:hypothetical protein
MREVSKPDRPGRAAPMAPPGWVWGGPDERRVAGKLADVWLATTGIRAQPARSLHDYSWVPGPPWCRASAMLLRYFASAATCCAGNGAPYALRILLISAVHSSCDNGG